MSQLSQPVRWASRIVLSILLLCSLGLPVLAQQGDCNGDSIVDIDDAIYLGDYLVSGGPTPPDMSKCDCDGFAGVNFGDYSHLVELAQSYYPSLGTDVPQPSNVRFVWLGRPDGVSQLTATLFVDAPSEMKRLAIPFSFAPANGEAVLNCTDIDTNLLSIAVIVHNTQKRMTLVASGDLQTDGWTPLLTAHFELDGSTGTPVEIKPISTAHVFPILLAKGVYDGIDGTRVFIPKFMRDVEMQIGDVDCSGFVDVDDVVYLAAYIFSGGPPPGDPDDDGIPNCP